MAFRMFIFIKSFIDGNAEHSIDIDYFLQLKPKRKIVEFLIYISTECHEYGKLRKEDNMWKVLQFEILKTTSTSCQSEKDAGSYHQFSDPITHKILPLSTFDIIKTDQFSIHFDRTCIDDDDVMTSVIQTIQFMDRGRLSNH